MKKLIACLLTLANLSFLSSCDDDDDDKINPCDASTLNASFNYDAYNNTVGTSMAFTSTSTGDMNGATYLWDFGDNTTSTQVSPNHTYASSGQFNVTLNVRNACGKSSDAETRTVTIISVPNSKVLPMSRVGQQTMVWCWAACSEMLLNYYSHPTPQCYILSTWFTFDCCTYPNLCQTTGTLQQIAQNLNYFGGLKATIKNTTLTLSEIATEISNNRPIIIAYTNYSSGHVVVIFGYDLINQYIHIYDPFFYNTGTANYSWIVPYTTTLTYSGNMQWTNSIYQIGY